MQSHAPVTRKPKTSSRPLVLPLSAISADMLPLVGRKAANLGELHRAGLPVPEGFCITTTAYERVSVQAGIDPVLSELAAADPGDTRRLAAHAASARLTEEKGWL